MNSRRRTNEESYVAVESAGKVLIRNNLRDVMTSMRVSKATVRQIKWNLFWASCYNIILIPVAFFGRSAILNPIFAAIVKATSSIRVNSMLLNRWNPKL